MFFSGWQGLLRTLIVGVLAYVTLIVFLRVSGKRTLAKMNAFDFVVTVALGSTLATVVLSKDVALAEGAVAFALLIALQFVVSWTSVRMRWAQKLVTGEPLILLYRGEMVHAALIRARVTEEDLRAAVRAAGIASLDAVHAVVLETDGSLSVVRPGESVGRSSLEGMAGIGAARESPGAPKKAP